MQDLSWAAGKKYMGNVDAFLKSLLTFNKDAIPLPCVEKCEKDYISNPAFNAANIRTKSGAAAGLCGWVINICKYFRIYQVCAFPRSAWLSCCHPVIRAAVYCSAQAIQLMPALSC